MNQTFCLGLFEVTDILDYDPVRKEVYFMSTENPNLKPNEDEDPKLRRDFKFCALILLAETPTIKIAPGTLRIINAIVIIRPAIANSASGALISPS